MSDGDSTKYLNDTFLDGKGLVIKDVLDVFKTNCGLFALLFSIYSNKDISNSKKEHLVKAMLKSTMEFMEYKYQVNLDLYERYALDNLEKGKKFEALAEVPAKLVEDYELGLKEANEILMLEIDNIIKSIESLFKV